MVVSDLEACASPFEPHIASYELDTIRRETILKSCDVLLDG